MKVKIKSFNGELPDYFTEGEEYQAINEDKYSMYVVDNNGDSAFCLFDDCSHLNGGSWEVVK